MMYFLRSIIWIFACFFCSQNVFASRPCYFSIPISAELNIAYDDFRGISEGSWNGNTGGVIGGNFGLCSQSFGVQLGGSYGAYDWNGRGPVGSGNSDNLQHQGFLTGGIFYKTPRDRGLQSGVVVDWMFNKNFGVFGLDPSLGQVRYQAGYLFWTSDEIGFWGTANISTDHLRTFQIPVAFRAINQLSLFWRHRFENCGEFMAWGGVPYQKSLLFSGKRSGKFILGACFRAPFSSCFCVEGRGMYMAPQGNRASPHFQSYGANICIGLTYFFGAGSNDCCEIWQARPYMPVANNSNFLVDTNLND